MKRCLFFDDSSNRHIHFDKNFNKDFEIDHAYTPAEAIELLKKNKYSLACLDHDMDQLIVDDGTTGMDVAEFIALHQERHLNPDKVIVHSWNCYMAFRMYQVIKEAGIDVVTQEYTV
jgi:hypothetical protein